MLAIYFGGIKLDIIDLIFKNREILNCTYKAYNSTIKQIANTQISDIHFNETIEIPKSIQEIAQMSQKLVKLVDDALNVVPIGTSNDTHLFMVEILTGAKWYDYSFEDVSDKLNISKSSYFRLKSAAQNTYYSNLSLLFNQNFKMVNFDSITENYHNIRQLMKIWNSINNQTNSSSLLKERLETADSISDIITIISENNYYLMYVKQAIKLLRTIGTNGELYYLVANDMLNKKSRAELGYYLRNYRFKYFGKKKVNKMIVDTENVLGIILFGINYLTIKEGFYITEK